MSLDRPSHGRRFFETLLPLLRFHSLSAPVTVGESLLKYLSVTSELYLHGSCYQDCPNSTNYKGKDVQLFVYYL